MPSATPAKQQAPAAPPTLPPNVTIFTPKDPGAAQALLRGKLFTRLTVTDKTTPAQIAAALKKADGVDERFCLAHRNVVLIFDGDDDDDDGRDAHHEHFRAVCLALRDADIGLSVAGCVHDAEGPLGAGFQLDVLSSGSVLVIDLMGGDEEEEEEEGESEDEEEALRALMGGETGTAV